MEGLCKGKANTNVTCTTWVVGRITAYRAVLRLTGLRGRSVTLGLQKAQLRKGQQWGILDNERKLDLATLRE